MQCYLHPTYHLIPSSKDRWYVKVQKTKLGVIQMVSFETIKSEEIKFGNNNFLEIARKKAVTEEGENTFISISRGFITPTGEKRYRKSFTVPLDENVIDFVCKKLKEV